MTGSSIDTETAAGNRRPCQPTKAMRSVKVQAANGKPINSCHPARARQLSRKNVRFVFADIPSRFAYIRNVQPKT